LRLCTDPNAPSPDCWPLPHGSRLAQVAAAPEPSDADFAAKAAFDRGDRARLEAPRPKLAGHLLEPYIEYWWLKDGWIRRATRKCVRSSRGGRDRRWRIACASNG
jgi:hypothetical protein